MAPSKPLAVVAALLILSAACSRSSLDALGLGSQTGGGAGGAGDGDGGSAPVPRCVLEPVGDPVALWSFPEGNADTPSLVTLDAGAGASAPGGARPARLVLTAISEDANFWHPELRLTRVRLDPSWPDGVALEGSPSLVGIDAHAWGELAPSSEPGEVMGLVWFRGDEAAGKPSGLKYRPIDPDDIGAGPEVFIDPMGSVTYRVAPGASFSAAGFTGRGFGIAYRSVDMDGATGPRVVVIDEAGSVVLGPVAPAAMGEYPGVGSSIVWSGSRYLVATAFDQCSPSDEHCSPQSIVVTRLDDEGELATAATFAAAADVVPSAPRLVQADGYVWLLWWEPLASDDDPPPRRLRAARLSDDGALAGQLVDLVAEARPTSPLSVEANALGVIAMFGEQGDHGNLTPAEPGFDRLRIVHRTLAGEQLVEPLAIDVGELGYYSPARSVATLDNPRGVLVTWAAQASQGHDAIFVLRLDCR